jgi:hypothetical protein
LVGENYQRNPSALAQAERRQKDLPAFAYGVQKLNGFSQSGWVQGLKIAAVAVMAQALWQMAKRLCPDVPRAMIAVMAAVVRDVSWRDCFHRATRNYWRLAGVTCDLPAIGILDIWCSAAMGTAAANANSAGVTRWNKCGSGWASCCCLLFTDLHFFLNRSQEACHCHYCFHRIDVL